MYELVERDDLQESKKHETEAAFVGALENHCNQDGVIKPLSNEVIERINALKDKAKFPLVAVINDDAGVAEDVAKIIGEPFEVSNEVNEDDCVLIPVKHLEMLIYAAKNSGLTFDGGVSEAIRFAESLF
jgi:hypothetical protein